jgi:hypothetical protein
MLKYTQIILFTTVLSLVGCASGPKPVKDRLASQACISDDANSANTAFTPTQSFLRFEEVDGVPVNRSDAPLCLTAGKHNFKLTADTDFRKLNGTVELDLKPDMSYWLRAKIEGSWGFGGAFDFKLLDVTSDEHVIVAEFSVPAEVKEFQFIYIPGGAVPVIILPK